LVMRSNRSPPELAPGIFVLSDALAKSLQAKAAPCRKRHARHCLICSP
jgi:hypothetical protein